MSSRLCLLSCRQEDTGFLGLEGARALPSLRKASRWLRDHLGRRDGGQGGGGWE